MLLLNYLIFVQNTMSIDCTLALHLGGPGFKSLPTVLANLPKAYYGFPKSLHTDTRTLTQTNKGMVRSDMAKPALIFFSLQEYTQQNTLSKF
jgi:hypothetical protein